MDHNGHLFALTLCCLTPWWSGDWASSRSHLHQSNSHENRDGAVSSRNELEAIILTESVSWWKKPAREKIDPGARQPAQWAVLER